MQTELAALIDRHTPHDGMFSTPISSLRLFRNSSPTSPVHGIQAPALAIVAQGKKCVVLGHESFLYDSEHYLVVSLDLPLSAKVISASRAKPYLALCLYLDVSQVASLRLAGRGESTINEHRDRGVFVSRLNADLLDPVIRLLRMLDRPYDIEVLEPLIQREILYRLLQGEQGTQLWRISQADSLTNRISKAIAWLQTNFNQPFSMEAITVVANMSPSGLQHHFKTLTNMSPLQYQKHLRLQKARMLMLSDTMDVASAAYQVGYVSPSQFSREYHRLFGASPLRDVEHLRRELDSPQISSK
jgi:AraC-like DNA-binding protein